MHSHPALLLVLLAACGSEAPAPADTPGPDPVDSAVDTGTTSVPPDPFAPQPDSSEGLVNASADLEALLEHGELVGACDRWRAAPDDRRLKLLCGKSMFFYEGFDTIGIPTALLDAIPKHFPDQVGPAFSKLGLVPDPFSAEGRPLGFGPGASVAGNNGDIETLAMTCASCHFGPLPDGRWAVGAPNHGYRYGTHMLSLMLAPMAAAPGFDESAHHPDAIAAVSPILDELEGNLLLQLALGVDLMPLAAMADDPAALDYETEGHYANWKPGTMDFTIAPLPIDDGVHTVSKIIALWGLPTAEEQAAAGMPHAMLAWNGGAETLMDFLEGFVVIGDGDGGSWQPDDLEPLHDYILSLTPPEPPAPGDVSSGEAVFFSAGCVSCHGAPRGGGDRVYTFDEIGTDEALMYWADPELTGTLCCGMGDGSDGGITHGVKSPRLVGLWAMERFLHNGSVDSLEQLLCLDDRPDVTELAYGSGGHDFGCDLPEADRRALADYLRAH